MTDTLYRLDLPAFCDWLGDDPREDDYRITVTECPIDELFDKAGRLKQSTHQIFPNRVAALSQGILMLTLAYEEAHRLNGKRMEAIESAQEELRGLLHALGSAGHDHADPSW
jgi:hypothetical protein